MADKYIYLGTNGLAEKEAITTSSGATDAGKIIATNSEGVIDESLLPAGIGEEVLSVTASENLSAGNLVNLWNDGGTLKVRKADASGGFSKKCDGFVKDSVSTGQSVNVYFTGKITGLSGLTIGSRYWLSATPGGVTTTIPTTSGYIAQCVGKAISATEIVFEKGEPIERA